MSQNDTEIVARRSHINPPVFFISAALIIVLVAFAAFYPELADRKFKALQQGIFTNASWFYILAVALILMSVTYLGLSRYGNIKLGPDHSRPDYSYVSWFAMLFAAGMGIGLMFFGVAEPIMHYATPPTGTAESAEAARQAMRITFFHWGVHAWAIYAVVALAGLLWLSPQPAAAGAIGALSTDWRTHPRPHWPRGRYVCSPWHHLWPGHVTWPRRNADQLRTELLIWPGSEAPVQVSLIGIIILVATGSVVAGLDSGVRRLSEINMIMAVALLAFVLVCGPTVHLMQAFVQNTGMYASQLFSMTFNLYAYEPSGWLGGWTLFYWGWWIAWSPFVGMFIARISRGRTVREFVVGVLLVPLGFTFLWMTIYGNSAINLIMAEGARDLANTVQNDVALALFNFLEHFPFSTILSFIAMAMVVVFFVTSADSGAMVVDTLASGGDRSNSGLAANFLGRHDGPGRHCACCSPVG